MHNSVGIITHVSYSNTSTQSYKSYSHTSNKTTHRRFIIHNDPPADAERRQLNKSSATLTSENDFILRPCNDSSNETSQPCSDACRPSILPLNDDIPDNFVSAASAPASLLDEWQSHRRFRTSRIWRENAQESGGKSDSHQKPIGTPSLSVRRSNSIGTPLQLGTSPSSSHFPSQFRVFLSQHPITSLQQEVSPVIYIGISTTIHPAKFYIGLPSRIFRITAQRRTNRSVHQNFRL